MTSRILLLFAIVCISNFNLIAQQPKANKPNFIIILTDDQGYNDLSCYGSQLIRTPNIDKMASEGIRFTDFYAQPICGPSRTALMTGCYPLKVAEIGNIKRMHPMIHPDEVLLPEVLKQVGYKTGCIGKWDLNGHQQKFVSDDIYPTEMGFDYWFGLPSSNDGGSKNSFRNKEYLGPIALDTLTQVYTSEAIDFIKRNKQSPFFLYLAHSMPHTRLGASSRFKGKSEFGLYGDVIEELDWSVGQIKETLIRHGLDKNTIVFFTSDNGPWRARGTHGGSAYPLRAGKATTWEGGVRVPGIAWGTGLLKKNIVTDQVTSTMDIFPTIASMAGAVLPTDRVIDGKDISKLLLAGEEAPLLESIYYYYNDNHLQAVRKGDWKLVVPRPQAPEWQRNNKKSIWRLMDVEPVRDFELYNLKKDISERRDVAAEFRNKIDELKLLINKARETIGDYNKIGSQARFYDNGVKQPSVLKWQKKERDGWTQEIKVHPHYTSGARGM
ncbi:MAG: arylsulfatase A-like enzyme [Cyclobacteriaceae bacterium]|jgi:arylsulfatase